MRTVLCLLAFSVAAFAQPAALDSSFIPKGLHVTAVTSSSVELEWTRVPKATTYRLWYGTAPAEMDFLGETAYPRFAKSRLSDGTRYFFSVSTMVGDNESPRSLPIVTETPVTGAPPATPAAAAPATTAPPAPSSAAAPSSTTTDPAAVAASTGGVTQTGSAGTATSTTTTATQTTTTTWTNAPAPAAPALDSSNVVSGSVTPNPPAAAPSTPPPSPSGLVETPATTNASPAASPTNQVVRVTLDRSTGEMKTDTVKTGAPAVAATPAPTGDTVATAATATPDAPKRRTTNSVSFDSLVAFRVAVTPPPTITEDKPAAAPPPVDTAAVQAEPAPPPAPPVAPPADTVSAPAQSSSAIPEITAPTAAPVAAPEPAAPPVTPTPAESDTMKLDLSQAAPPADTVKVPEPQVPAADTMKAPEPPVVPEKHPAPPYDSVERPPVAPPPTLAASQPAPPADTVAPVAPAPMNMDSLARTMHNSDYDSTVAALNAEKKQRAPKAAIKKAPPQKMPKPARPIPAPPAPTADAPPSAPPATEQGTLRNVYTVQIEASVDYNTVQKHLAMLKKKNADARVETFHNKGTTWYRLRVGAYKSKEEARTELAALKWTAKSFATHGPAMFYNDAIMR